MRKTILVSIIVIIALTGCKARNNSTVTEGNNDHEIVFQFRVYDHGNTLSDSARVKLNIAGTRTDGKYWSYSEEVGPIFDYKISVPAGEKLNFKIEAFISGKPGNQVDCTVLEDGVNVGGASGIIQWGSNDASATCIYGGIA